MSAPLNRAMLLGDDEPLTPGELDRYADTGVGVFLAAYGTHWPARSRAPTPAARVAARPVKRERRRSADQSIRG